MSERRAYWRIVPKLTSSAADLYRRRFASREDAEAGMTYLDRVNYEAAEYTPTGKRCIDTTPNGTTIE